MPGLRDFLVRVALDDAFRDLVRSDPDGAFVGYDLDDGQKATLRTPDAGWLSLLGGAVRAGAPEVHVPPEAPPGPPLPEARLLLTLRPYATPESGGMPVGWAASLHPWPSDADPDALRFVVRFTATAAGTGDARLASYTASILEAPPPGASEAEPIPVAGPSPLAPDPSGAARAVLAAPPGERYARLRDLLAVIGATT